MSYLLFGLGNPGDEYEGTRHNVGKELSESVKFVKSVRSDEFMNNSGKAVGKLVKSKKAAEKLIVIHDDLDLPLGTFKISFARGAGGHRGVESVIRALKTEAFIRIRVGVSRTTPSGKLKKPYHEKIVKFILGKFTPLEHKLLKKVSKKVYEAIETIISDGLASAMNRYN